MCQSFWMNYHDFKSWCHWNITRMWPYFGFVPVNDSDSARLVDDIRVFHDMKIWRVSYDHGMTNTFQVVWTCLQDAELAAPSFKPKDFQNDIPCHLFVHPYWRRFITIVAREIVVSHDSTPCRTFRGRGKDGDQLDPLSAEAGGPSDAIWDASRGSFDWGRVANWRITHIVHRKKWEINDDKWILNLI